MTIESPKFKNEQQIPLAYTCDGGAISPPLNFRDVPTKAKSLALIMDDPDSPSGTFVHWLLWNMLPNTTIPENVTPAEAEIGINSGEEMSYYPPCPHIGEHRYFFRLYALDVMLDLSSGADKEELEQAISGHVLAEAELKGLFKRI